jgi:hypothetical protein
MELSPASTLAHSPILTVNSASKLISPISSFFERKNQGHSLDRLDKYGHDHKAYLLDII